MDYKTNSSGKILNMDKPGIFFLASDGKPYEFRHDTIPGSTTANDMPVKEKDIDRASKTIEVGAEHNRWKIEFNDKGYVKSMKNISTVKGTVK